MPTQSVVFGAVPLFVGSYLAVWALVGVAVFAVYRPHGTTAAGVVAIAAGVYEFTPLKQHFRRHCHQRQVRSGFQFGPDCVGSSIGLMLMMVALGIMSVTWMTVIRGHRPGPEAPAHDSRPRRPVGAGDRWPRGADSDCALGRTRAHTSDVNRYR